MTGTALVAALEPEVFSLDETPCLSHPSTGFNPAAVWLLGSLSRSSAVQPLSDIDLIAVIKRFKQWSAQTPTSIWPLIEVLTLTLPPSILVGQAQDPGSVSQLPAATALKAIKDLELWLRLNQDEVAELTGIGRRSIPYWRAGKKPRLSTVRRLFEVHSLVASLVRALGLGQARTWLGIQEGEKTRLDILRDQGPLPILRLARPLLFPASPDHAPPPEIEDFEWNNELTGPPHPERFVDTPVHPRIIHS